MLVFVLILTVNISFISICREIGNGAWDTVFMPLFKQVRHEPVWCLHSLKVSQILIKFGVSFVDCRLGLLVRRWDDYLVTVSILLFCTSAYFLKNLFCLSIYRWRIWMNSAMVTTLLDFLRWVNVHKYQFGIVDHLLLNWHYRWKAQI